MTLISVVLPEPLGPTRPKISPSRTSRSTPRQRLQAAEALGDARAPRRMSRSPIGGASPAARPAPLRRCAVATGGAAAPPASFCTAGTTPSGSHRMADDQDQADDGAADHRLAAADEGVEQGGDDGGADRRPQPVARAAQHAHQHDVERHGELEGAGHGEEADIHGMDAADGAGDAGRQREGRDLVAEGRHALGLGHVLVVMDGEQAHAEARMGDPPGRWRACSTHIAKPRM